MCSGQQLWQKAWRDRCRPIHVSGKEETQDVGWRAQFGGVKQAMKDYFHLSGPSNFPWTLVSVVGVLTKQRMMDEIEDEIVPTACVICIFT